MGSECRSGNAVEIQTMPDQNPEETAIHLSELLVHAMNYFGSRDASIATGAYDALARVAHRHKHARDLDCSNWIAEVRLQQTADVIWGIGNTLAVPEYLSHQSDLRLVLPNNTNLDSSAQLLAAAEAKTPGMRTRLNEWKQKNSPASCGDAVSIGPGLGFQEVVHVICREPGDPALTRLNCGLAAAMSPGSYNHGRLVIPVWGSEDDLTVWADALGSLAADATTMQSPVRLPVILLFRPEEEARGIALQRMLIERGLLVLNQQDYASCHSSMHNEDLGIPDEVFAEVGTDRLIHPLKFAKWVSRGLRMPARVWLHHLEIWRDHAAD